VLGWDVRPEGPKDETPRGVSGTERQRLRERLDDSLSLARAMAGPADPRGLADACRDVIELADALGDPAAKANAFQMLGQAYLQLGELDGAREAYEQAAGLWQGIGAVDRELQTRQALAGVLLDLGDPHAALNQASQLADAPDWVHRCLGLLTQSHVRQRLGQFGLALAGLEEAQRTVSRAEATFRAHVHQLEASLHLSRGDTKAALASAQAMADAGASAASAPLRLDALILMGTAHTRRGEMAEGWQPLDQALQVAELAGDAERTARVNVALSEWFALAGLCEPALTHAYAAQRGARACASHSAELEAELALAEAFLAAEDLDNAEGPIARASELAEGSKDFEGHVRAELLKGRLAAAAGDHRAAIALLSQVMTEADEAEAQSLTAEAKLHLASVQLAQTDRRNASKTAHDAIEIAGRLQARHTLWQGYHVLARIAQSKGQHHDASENYRQAIAVIEGIWWPLSSIGLAEPRDVKPAVLNVYFDALRLAADHGEDEAVNRILSLSPWPFLRQRWEERIGSS